MFPESSPKVDFSEETFQRLQKVLQEKKNLDLYSYENKCIKRRIAVRIRARQCGSPEEYLKLLKKEKDELELLFNVLTINYSQFFRNPETFTQIKNLVYPEILSSKRTERSRSILSLGCATGEEPYSLALILIESFSFRMRDFTVRIEGMDLDAECLKQAREGLYRPEQLTNLAPRTRNRYFIPEGKNYRLVDEVKKIVRFRQRDVFRDRIADYPNYFDLIVCRNVLIYFTRQEEERALAKCEEALKEGGFLVLGRSESLLGRIRQTFKVISSRESIYQKKYRRKKSKKQRVT